MGVDRPPANANATGNKGKGRGGAAKGAGKKGQAGKSSDAAKRLQEIDGSSIEAESNIEILRAQRAAARRGTTVVRDSVRENEGVDEEDPLMTIDAGIRIEPFNMRREMAEGHFDEGGFYVLNKDQEKEVTDAWLDTVDKAARTASFKREESKKKAGAAAASRISAISRNLKEGGDDDEEKEEDDDEEGEAEKEAAAAKEGAEASEAPAEQNLAEDPKAGGGEPEEEEQSEISILESLIGELLPLETPIEALARLARASQSSSGGDAQGREKMLPALKTRSAIKKARAEAGVAAKQVESQPEARTLQKQRKRKLNEFGYEDMPERSAKVAAVDIPADLDKSGDAKMDSAVDENAGDNGVVAQQPAEQGAAAAAAPSEDSSAVQPEAAEEGKQTTAGSGPDAQVGLDCSASTVTNAAQIALAAERAAAKEKAEAEAAAAFAAEMKMSKHVLHVGVDDAGPETAALLNLNSDEAKAAKDARAAAAVEEDADVDNAAKGPNQRRKQADASAGTLERRKKIEVLTDLCDALLQKGVNVYDSTRELLAIEVRTRKGEKLTVDDDANGQAKDQAGGPSGGKDASKTDDSTAAGPGKQSSGGATAAMVFTNSRCVTSGEQASVVDAEAFVNARVADQTLYWQFRWVATPEDTHGPFDSLTMHGWMSQGCFAEERPAEIRQCDSNNTPSESCWHPWDKVNFELYL